MAGEPIVFAHKCAIVIADEPAARALNSNAMAKFAGFALDLADGVDAPVLDLRAGSDAFLIDKALVQKIAEMQRRSLIVAGGLLEGAVTQIALSSLLDGYDVFVCADLVVTADPVREETFFGRLRACTGYVVTSRQILLELLSQEENPKKRKPLETLLAKGVSGGRRTGLS